MNNRIYLIVIALLLIASVYLGVKLNKANQTNVQQIEVIEEGELDRERLELDLERMKLSYDTLYTDNTMLRAEMDAQMLQIDDLLSKVKDKNWSIHKLKKESETLRDIMKGYVVTIDSLNTLNQNLLAENADMRNTVQSVQDRNKNLLDRQENMESIISTGQVLQAMNNSSTAIRLRSSGKQAETNRASKTEMIKSCFTLLENRIAKKGSKQLYLRIIDPNGKVLSTSVGEQSRKFDDEVGAFSIQRQIDYNNQQMDVCIFYTVNSELVKGDYKIFIYEDGQRIGASDLSLK